MRLLSLANCKDGINIDTTPRYYRQSALTRKQAQSTRCGFKRSQPLLGYMLDDFYAYSPPIKRVYSAALGS